MSWEREVEEIQRRRELAKQMGGPERIARQHARGKLTVRERIERLADPGSWKEFMGLAGYATYDGTELASFTPKAQVDGMCTIGGRPAVVTAGDFTIAGGSGGGHGGGLGAELSAHERALEWRVPLVRLLDAAGGSVKAFEEIGRTYLPDGNIWSQVDVRLLSVVPVVSAVMGSVAGLPAVNACMAHWNVMTKDTGQLFPGGPPVVKSALGVDITKEELGGWQIHGKVSGVVDNIADTEDDAFCMVSRFLSYLPPSVYELPERLTTTDDAGRRDESLLSLVPHNPRQPWRAQKLIESVVDQGSFFEIAPMYGRARITGLARVNGYPVGVMCNDPFQQGGSTDVAAGEKVMRLIGLCDTFHLPIVDFADEPGFMVGIDSERQGIERAGARMICAVNESRTPWITFVIRRLYGVAGQCHHRPTGMFRRYAWPSASWGSMPIQGGTSAAYRREIDNAPDPEARRIEIEQRLQLLASPFRTAEATGQDIIDPRDTRPLLVEFVEQAQRILHTQVGPPLIPYRP